MTLFDIKYDDFKREDTTNVIAITLYTDDRQPITPDASHTWKAKVSKGDKYVGEYPVTISDNTIKLSSSNLTRLPNGDYGLELWETYDGSTTIYPSAGVMEFRVHRNANDTLGTIDPTTDINAIIEDLHKAGQNIKVVATNTLSPGSKASVTQSIANGENQLTFNIPQGHKGEQGNVGPAPTLKVGTVTKLNPDQAPTVDLTGGNGSYTLNIGIPQGIQGETNETATNALNLANSKANTTDINWTNVVANSNNTYNYASGSKITLPNNSNITVKDDRIIPHIYLPTYITDFLPNTELNTLATMGEYDNLFVPSATMDTLTSRPINPDTNDPLTGDCFFSNHFAFNGTTTRAFQKFYSCDYNYVFLRSYNGSSVSWSNWSCLAPHA